MAKTFRLWEKKRGDRRTGSRLVGAWGEAVFFGLLFLLGTISLTFLVLVQVMRADPRILVPGMGFWLVVLVLASFILLGGGGLVYSILQIGASAERRSALARRAAGIDFLGDSSQLNRRDPTLPADANFTNSPGIRLAFRLPLSHTTAWQLLAATLFCLVWNGMTAVLLTVTVNGHVHGEPDWILTGALVPFLAIGGWALFFFIQQLLLHTGIGPTHVEISDHPLYPGQTYTLFLSQAGRQHFDALELHLVCEEESNYQQGTDIRAESQVVFSHRVLRQTDFQVTPSSPCETECRFQIPHDAMHSFQATHNSINWRLVVRGEAHGWPPFERIFPIVVYPSTPNPGLVPSTVSHGTTH